jgi:hypothetical protein
MVISEYKGGIAHANQEAIVPEIAPQGNGEDRPDGSGSAYHGYNFFCS